jgi:uncharacterized protein (TIGR03086 family)
MNGRVMLSEHHAFPPLDHPQFADHGSRCLSQGRADDHVEHRASRSGHLDTERAEQADPAAPAGVNRQLAGDHQVIKEPCGPGRGRHGQDPPAAYAEASAAALTAASAGDTLTRVHTTPLGDMPGPALAGFTTLDILVHGWDLAQATGQPAALDDTLAAHVLAFAEQAITPGSRAPRIGPAVPVAADAPLTNRLVAFLGRQP